MRRLICAIWLVLSTGVAVGQQSLPDRPPGASPRAEEIDELRSTLDRLNQRLNQLAPAASMSSDPVVSKPAATVFACPVQDSPEPCHHEDPPKWQMTAAWENGLQIKSSDDAFRVHVGGRLQFDSGWNMASQTVQFGPGGTGEFQDGAYFRRARIRIDGTMYSHIEWVAEFDFANDVENDTSSSTQTIGSPSFKDVWIGINDLPVVGTVRIGWMKEPIGFEHLTSTNWLNFMERAPGTDSLTLRSPGILFRDAILNQRMTWAIGVFHAQNDNFGFGDGDGQYAVTGRLTGLPWYADDGRELLHLGIGATHRHLNDNEITLKGRPSVRTMPGALEPALADTGSIGGTTMEVVDTEVAGVYGPWTLQSEYASAWIHDAVFPNDPPPKVVARGTLFYQTAYVELLYFLTGEYRAYERDNGVFGRVVPLRNFNIWDGPAGWGAWQVGVRYGYLDLQNKGVNGATLQDMTFGLNWFLNPNAKVQWNLAVDHRESTPPGSSGWTYIFGSRVALDF
jgi:phosphate-selective porin OprO/OprP